MITTIKTHNFGHIEVWEEAESPVSIWSSRFRSNPDAQRGFGSSISEAVTDLLRKYKAPYVEPYLAEPLAEKAPLPQEFNAETAAIGTIVRMRTGMNKHVRVFEKTAKLHWESPGTTVIYNNHDVQQRTIRSEVMVIFTPTVLNNGL